MLNHRIVFVLFLTIFAFSPLLGQNPQQLSKSKVMQYVVNGKDTTYLDELPPAKIHPRQTMSETEWVKYYKRVHNFSKSYPYALFISKTIKETDALFIEKKMSKRQKNKYLANMKDELLKDFDPIFRNLTLKQGLMMIRLIDREVGTTPYYILKQYFGGATAGFWQGVAKLFKGDLKRPYDRFGEDKDLEELVGYWERDEFADLYVSIFGKLPPETYIPEKFKK